MVIILMSQLPRENNYGSGFKYFIDGIVSPLLNFEVGKTYEFDLSDVPKIHPFYLSSIEDGRLGWRC